MKQAPFSRPKGCKCPARELDKNNNKSPAKEVLRPQEEGEVCLSVCLALFTGNREHEN